jgi:hypothetical protein
MLSRAFPRGTQQQQRTNYIGRGTDRVPAGGISNEIPDILYAALLGKTPENIEMNKVTLWMRNN